MIPSLRTRRFLSAAVAGAVAVVAAAADYPTPEGQRLREALVQEATLPALLGAGRG